MPPYPLMAVARPAVWSLIAAFLCAHASAASPQGGEESGVPQGPDIQWVAGPFGAQLGDQAQIEIPEGYAFLNGADTATYMEWMGNFPTNTEVGCIEPLADEDADWLIVFEWSDQGYVKDDEQSELIEKSDDLLETITENNERGNEIRRDRGQAALDILGWELAPKYHTDTRNLEWALRMTSAGHLVLNHQIKILGRHGLMDVTVIVSPERYEAVMPMARELLSKFEYVEGSTYGEWKVGDKVSEYGLTALIAGGGLAIAAKTGLLQKLLKPILIGIVAIGAFFKRIVSGLFGGGSKEPQDQA